MTIERIQQLAKNINGLVTDPQPGLMSWCGALHENVSELCREWGGQSGSQNQTTTSKPSRQIVIGERGWVWVGDVSRDGSDYVLTNAQNIRAWGTKNGLGELATKGKQNDTKLDPCGTIRIPELAVIGRIDVVAGVNL